MNETYRNLVASAGAAAVTYIGLVDDDGDELAGGAYLRQAVSWTAPSNGLVRPVSNLVFDIPAGTTVGGWRGYNALVDGTDYDGADLTAEVFSSSGQYTLLAAGTGIAHNAG
jgi:hypothetical protein